MDPITQALVLLALKEAPNVVLGAIKMVNAIKAGEPTEAAIEAFLAIKHPTYKELLAEAAPRRA